MTATLLPQNATVMERAVEGALAARDVPVPLRALWDADACPDELLPWLGWALHIDGFDAIATADEKRAAIRLSVALHRHKGTPWSIRQALSALGFSSRIEEWFEYGGAPYTFRVEIESPGRAIDEALWARLVELVTEYKNVRSHLETLTLIATTRADIRVGIAVIGGDDVTVTPYRVTARDAPSPSLRFGIGVQHWSHATVHPLQ